MTRNKVFIKLNSRLHRRLHYGLCRLRSLELTLSSCEFKPTERGERSCMQAGVYNDDIMMKTAEPRDKGMNKPSTPG